MVFSLDSSKIAKPFVAALALSSLAALALQYPSRAAMTTLYAQGSAPGIPNPSGVPTGNYTIRPGDTIRIDNLEGGQFSGDYLVPPDGNLSLPMIGSVSVVGLTIQEAAEVVTAKYRRFFKYPQVGVSLLRINPLNITIAGEVNSPGTYIIPVQNLREGGIQFPTATQAIEQFGGITISADLGRVQVRRRQSNGQQQAIYLNLLNFILAGDSSQNITLRDGDTIFIPTKNEVNLREIRQLALANFAVDLSTARTVTVVGEVTHPGSYSIKGGDSTGGDKPFAGRADGLPTVSRALQLAGGVTRSANIRQIQIRRTTKTGKQQFFTIDLWEFLQAGDVTQNTILQDGDTIVIPTAANLSQTEILQIAEASFAADLNTPRTVTVVGEVTRPGAIVVRGGDTVGINTQFAGRNEGLPTLTRVLQLAGGVTRSADIRRVEIRRRTRSGAERVINVNLWEFLQTGNRDLDPILEDGDTIVIPTTTNLSQTEILQIAEASFAAELNTPRTVTVVGEVTRPGTIVIRGGDTVGINTQFAGRIEGLPTLTRLLQLVGGVTRSADIRRVEIRRRTRSGAERVINVNLWEFLQTGNRDLDPILEDGDTILIPIATSFNEVEIRQIAETSFAADINTPRTVTVVGEVIRPGTIVVRGGDTAGINTQFAGRNEGLPTLTRVLQLVGGVTRSADIRRVEIRRRNRSGAERVINVNLWELLQTGDSLNLDPIVEDGDTILIPIATDFNEIEARRISQASFAAEINTPRTVTVLGEVIRPGPIVVRGGDTVGINGDRFAGRVEGLPTVTRSIQLAGGITELADIRRVQLRRATKSGAERVISVNLWELLQTGDPNQDPIVEEGDTIVIPKGAEINPAEAARLAAASFSPNTISIYVMGEGARPGGVRQDGNIQIPSGTPLNQGLLAAGIFNSVRANKSEVALIRLNPDGTANQRTIKVNLEDGINEETNPLLRNNDVLIVNRSGFTKVSDASNTFASFLLAGPRIVSIFQILDILGVINIR